MNDEYYAKEDIISRIEDEYSEIEATDGEQQKLIKSVNNTNDDQIQYKFVLGKGIGPL